ncbi:hypothetical protein TBLA_0D01580 [Henningerozyma blattae CBS 6284]|uniref:Large ribosomal subunit protein bL33m n=1 Tax=Henningerozyma blattae (strain ATCC 34711 / CBS 6284 / DSM 70876 / NBRC 10599 / NRRL Y-10934 / UCD 77-7) TaxID=1071380 RepID=I2H2R4_HENB6|nr:hypothetical protein TBLA_0D01580 [Tetrapisispora blattae CBS 6284]CCH60666.1 hypothetical protein TBLA_0D01580 [Tetrapisispora blattae CBS 6284]
MAKDKAKTSVVKLLSTAATGFSRYIRVKRGAPLVTQVRYDPIAQRHVVFTEAKKRKFIPQKPLNFSRNPKQT